MSVILSLWASSLNQSHPDLLEWVVAVQYPLFLQQTVRPVNEQEHRLLSNWVVTDMWECTVLFENCKAFIPGLGLLIVINHFSGTAIILLNTAGWSKRPGKLKVCKNGVQTLWAKCGKGDMKCMDWWDINPKWKWFFKSALIQGVKAIFRIYIFFSPLAQFSINFTFWR